MDDFLTKYHCDRCGKTLEFGRTTSKLNNECICMTCKEKEIKDQKEKDSRDRIPLENGRTRSNLKKMKADLDERRRELELKRRVFNAEHASKQDSLDMLERLICEIEESINGGRKSDL